MYPSTVYISSQSALNPIMDAYPSFGLVVIGKSTKLAGNALYERPMKKPICE